MFKNKKVDSKVRFQHTAFRNQLQSARHYKRNARKIPEKDWELFFVSVGLGGWVRKSIAGAFALLIVYLLYVPNFLFIKTIDINGLDASSKPQVMALVQNYLTQKPLQDQKNIILLSKNNLAKFILAQSPQIIKINSIEKVFPSSLLINVEQRTTAAVLSTPDGQFLISSDGLVQQQLGQMNTSTLALLPHVTITATTTVSSGEAVFAKSIVDSFGQINTLAQSELHVSPDHFELSTATSTDLTLITKEGYSFYFDVRMNVQASLDQISLVLQNTSDSQKKNLYYIDMRFPGRGFVCFNNTPCAQNIPIKNIATTTLDTTISP